MALLRVPQSPSLRLGLSFYAATHGRWPAELLPAWRAGGWNSALKPYSRLTKTRGVPQAPFGIPADCDREMGQIARINAEKNFRANDAIPATSATTSASSTNPDP